MQILGGELLLEKKNSEALKLASLPCGTQGRGCFFLVS